MANIEMVNQELAPLIEEIKQHPLYACIHSINDLRTFMEYHVFAVWDFMCLLKVLYARVVSTQAPWFPPRDGYSAHLISRILIEEESDRTEDSQGYCSHFELYLAAMGSIGANTQPMALFLQRLSDCETIMTAATILELPMAIQQFIKTTFSFFSKDAHIIAAAFVYGREAITSSLFTPLVRQLDQTIYPGERGLIKPLLYYLNRHIELDDTEHLPRSLKMLAHLTGDDQKRWQEVLFHARHALQARLDFLTNIQIEINNRHS